MRNGSGLYIDKEWGLSLSSGQNVREHLLEFERLFVTMKQNLMWSLMNAIFLMIKYGNELKTPLHKMEFFYQVNDELEFFHFSVQISWVSFWSNLAKSLTIPDKKVSILGQNAQPSTYFLNHNNVQAHPCWYSCCWILWCCPQGTTNVVSSSTTMSKKPENAPT